jgi:hypothetical protein
MPRWPGFRKPKTPTRIGCYPSASTVSASPCLARSPTNPSKSVNLKTADECQHRGGDSLSPPGQARMKIARGRKLRRPKEAHLFGELWPAPARSSPALYHLRLCASIRGKEIMKLVTSFPTLRDFLAGRLGTTVDGCANNLECGGRARRRHRFGWRATVNQHRRRPKAPSPLTLCRRTPGAGRPFPPPLRPSAVEMLNLGRNI